MAMKGHDQLRFSYINTTGLFVALLVVMLSASAFWRVSGSKDERDTCDSATTGPPPSSAASAAMSASTSTSLHESAALVVPKFHQSDISFVMYQFDSIASTQDEARRIAEQDDLSQIKTFTVTTREQTKGRGTNGRSWMGSRGNTFVTIGIRQQDWMNLPSKIPLTLLPLKIGSLVASRVQEQLLKNCQQDGSDLPLVTVKWPNDVLVNERKISGVLIESSSNGWFLIGIGINLARAPEVPQSGPNRGRPSTSIYDVCPQSQFQDSHAGEQLGIDLSYDLHTFLVMEELVPTSPSKSAQQVLDDWKQWVDWDMELEMRDTPERERVRLLDVLPDGRVKVQSKVDGTQRTLVSDYFL